MIPGLGRFPGEGIFFCDIFALTIRVKVGLKNEFGSASPFAIFWKSFKRIRVKLFYKCLTEFAWKVIWCWTFVCWKVFNNSFNFTTYNRSFIFSNSSWFSLGAIPLLVIYPEKIITQKDTCTLMFTAAVFTIART